jgi:hypothetical protein
MCLIRTSGTTGYYLDIYRSDNAESNDYIYHNIGDSLQFLDSNRKPLRAVPAEYPLKGNDNPGFRFFKKVQKAESRNEDMIALFSAQNNKQENIYMQLLIPSKTGRDYYRAFSLKTKTAGRYSGKELPVFTMRDNGESWNKPFIVVFEPYKGESGFSVERVSAEKRDDGKDFTALTVFNRNGSKQIIFQSVDGDKIFLTGDGTFAGHLGIADFKGNRIKALYLGEGNEINYGGYSLRTEHTGSGEIKIEEKKLTISCNQSTIIGIPSGKVKKISFYDGAKTVYPGLDRKKETIYITVPEVKNGVIYLE